MPVCPRALASFYNLGCSCQESHWTLDKATGCSPGDKGDPNVVLGEDCPSMMVIR
jgi:hypothetical protein